MVLPNWTVTYKRLNPYTGWDPQNTAVVAAPDAVSANAVARATHAVGTFTDPGGTEAPYPEFIVRGIVAAGPM